MARSRNIKPGFFENEELAAIDPHGRLLFIGLWLLADRSGLLEYRPKRIRAQLFPYEDVDVEKLLEDLESARVIKVYVANSNKYIHIINFSKHQNPHKNEKHSVLPHPPKGLEECSIYEPFGPIQEITGVVEKLPEPSRKGTYDSG